MHLIGSEGLVHESTLLQTKEYVHRREIKTHFSRSSSSKYERVTNFKRTNWTVHVSTYKFLKYALWFLIL